MKTIPEHIQHIKGKPHHIRKRVAFTVAGASAGVIGLVWLVGSVSSGVFALKPTSFAQSAEGAPVTVVGADESGSSGLAGAAAAPAVQDANAPAHIDIVDVAPTSTPQAEQTTIPF
jgi:hypothetical protein